MTVVRAEEALRRFTYLSKWVCIPCITYRTCFILAGIGEASLLQAVDTAVTMNLEWGLWDSGAGLCGGECKYKGGKDHPELYWGCE